MGSGAVEALEDVGQLAGRDAGSVVADVDHDLAVARGRGDRAGGAGRSVHQHVHEQVADCAAEQFLVAHRGKAGGDPDPPGPPGIGDQYPLGASGRRR